MSQQGAATIASVMTKKKPELEKNLFRQRPARRHILFVRVSSEERTLIADAARDAGMTVVDFIRAAARDAIQNLRAPKRPKKA